MFVQEDSSLCARLFDLVKGMNITLDVSKTPDKAQEQVAMASIAFFWIAGLSHQCIVLWILG